MMTALDFWYLRRRAGLSQKDMAILINRHPVTLNRVLRKHAGGLPIHYEAAIRWQLAIHGVEVPGVNLDGSVAVPTPSEPHYTRRNPPPGHYWSAKFKAFVKLEHMPYANRVKNRLRDRLQHARLHSLINKPTGD